MNCIDSIKYTHMKRILMIGCSNLVGFHHAFRHVVFGHNIDDCYRDYLADFGQTVGPSGPIGEARINQLIDRHCVYSDVEIYNLSQEAAGNQYILGRLVDHIDQHGPPDYAYLQFSGLSRVDIPLSQNSIIREKLRKDRGTAWLTSGGFGGHLARKDREKDIWVHVYDAAMDGRNVHIHSWTAIASAINLLSNMSIPHDWTFYYNVEDPAHAQARRDGSSPYPAWVDTGRRLPTNPHDYSVSQNTLESDGIHFGMINFLEWLKTVRDHLAL